MNHTDKLLMALLSDQSMNRSDAISKIVNASRNASSLEGLRSAIEHIAYHAQRIDALREENFRKLTTTA